MGLLDDAIREHLELKRRHGADPGEIAHQERAALEPEFPDETGEPDGAEPFADEADEPDGAEPFADEQPPRPEPSAASTAEPGGEGAIEDFSHAGQETAEIDMSRVLEEQAPGDVPGQERLSFE
jgi:hypothetical protein